MVDIEELKHEIIERLKPLKPSKVILFGSYAYGTPNEDSDIDLYLVKDGNLDKYYEARAMMQLRDLTRKHHIGFDILSSSTDILYSANDPFYKIDILGKGKVIYGE